MEIEQKFSVHDAQSFDALANLTSLGDYHLRHADQVDQHNNYYDTADGLLEQAGYGLRLRTVAGRSVATLKGPAQSHDGLFKRGEWEVAATDPHPATWPPGEARSTAESLLGDRPLLPLLIIQTQRRHIYAARAGQECAEISLDSSTIAAGGLHESFAELEIELLPAGSEADIQALAAALAAHIALTPESRSKLQRGQELLARARQQAE